MDVGRGRRRRKSSLLLAEAEKEKGQAKTGWPTGGTGTTKAACVHSVLFVEGLWECVLCAVFCEASKHVSLSKHHHRVWGGEAGAWLLFPKGICFAR